MEDYYNAHKGFNCEKFEAERFGVGRDKMGFLNWCDVARYFGISATAHANERYLRHGDMSAPMYDCLTRLYGQESMAEYFPKPKVKPLTKEEREIEELGTLIAGSINDIKRVRGQR